MTATWIIVATFIVTVTISLAGGWLASRLLFPPPARAPPPSPSPLAAPRQGGACPRCRAPLHRVPPIKEPGGHFLELQICTSSGCPHMTNDTIDRMPLILYAHVMPNAESQAHAPARLEETPRHRPPLKPEA